MHAADSLYAMGFIELMLNAPGAHIRPKNTRERCAMCGEECELVPDAETPSFAPRPCMLLEGFFRGHNECPQSECWLRR